MADVFTTLEQRGYIYQATNYDKLKKLLQSSEKFTFYLGIDPTADSLHIGHFFALMVFKYLQEAGNRGVLVIGGATAMVGDPSGKSDMRKMISQDVVDHNIAEVKTLASRFINTTGNNPAIILNNNDWFKKQNYVGFMREIGQHFNVNRMLASEAYSKRMEKGGLTFLEMGYMLMQAFDFEHLNQKYSCILQLGGSDQWGNITAGIRLHRQLMGHSLEKDSELLGFTNPLLLTKDGKKMGKTENGTLWVAREKTTPYDFYQYFYNVDDSDVKMLLKLFTRINLQEIDNLVDEDILRAKRVMAYEITKLVHGLKAANESQEMALSLFSKNNNREKAPTVDFSLDPSNNNKILLTELITAVGLTKSKTESRRLIKQNGISVNGEKITNEDYIFTNEFIYSNNPVLLQKGKKTFVKVDFK